MMTTISERRQLLTYDDESGAVGFLSVWVDNVQIAAAVKQDESYAQRNDGAQWSLWSSGLTLRALTPPDDERATAAHPLAIRTEGDARAWLFLLADLAESGPRIVESRTR